MTALITSGQGRSFFKLQLPPYSDFRNCIFGHIDWFYVNLKIQNACEVIFKSI